MERGAKWLEERWSKWDFRQSWAWHTPGGDYEARKLHGSDGKTVMGGEAGPHKASLALRQAERCFRGAWAGGGACGRPEQEGTSFELQEGVTETHGDKVGCVPKPEAQAEWGCGPPGTSHGQRSRERK